jgi:formiminotetrahydrofolate cyclodeaminase
MDLETIKFNWKDKKSKGAQKEVGFNAQNLQKVIPEATYTIPSNGKLGIKDDAIIATLTKAIQEQQEMIEELQKEIKRIKRKIK